MRRQTDLSELVCNLCAEANFPSGSLCDGLQSTCAQFANDVTTAEPESEESTEQSVESEEATESAESSEESAESSMESAESSMESEKSSESVESSASNSSE